MARSNTSSFKDIKIEKRKAATKSIRKAFLIACEGISTEPNYISELVKDCKEEKLIAAGTELVIAKHGHTDPLGVYEDLKATPDYDNFDEYWIVIDRDEVELNKKGQGGHSEKNFKDALKSCKKDRINVACSNPCFELWIVLHFEYRNTSCSRRDIQKKAKELVNSLLPNVKPLKSVDDLKTFAGLYYVLKDRIQIAMKNSEKLDQSNPFSNPSTGMCLLVRALMKQ